VELAGVLFVELMKVVDDWLWCSDRIDNKPKLGLGYLDSSTMGRMKGKIESIGY
jgi:hypothetical protein